MEGEWLFKGSLVGLTTKLVSVGIASDTLRTLADYQTAKEASGGLMDLVIPLIEESLVTPAKEHFEEEGLTLSVDQFTTYQIAYDQMANELASHHIAISASA